MQMHTKISSGADANLTWADFDYSQFTHASPVAHSSALPDVDPMQALFDLFPSDDAASPAISSCSASSPPQSTPAVPNAPLPFEMDLNAFFAPAPPAEPTAYPLELAFSQYRETELAFGGLNDVGFAAFGLNFAGSNGVDDKLMAALTATAGISPQALQSPPGLTVSTPAPVVQPVPANTPLMTPATLPSSLKRKQSSSSSDSSGTQAKKVKAATPAPAVNLTKRKARPAGGAARKVVPQKYIVSGHAQRATGLSESQLRSFPTFDALLAAVPDSHKALAQEFGAMIEAARLKACGATKESREKREREMVRLEAEAKRWQAEYARLREWVGTLVDAGKLDEADIPVLSEREDDDDDDE
jgi:hypothetical protein